MAPKTPLFIQTVAATVAQEEQRHEGQSAATVAQELPLPATLAAPACLALISAPPVLPCTGKEGPPPSASAICDLEYMAGSLRGCGLSADDVRRRLELFPKTAGLPIWRAHWGARLVRLPEAPDSFGQVVVYCPKERLHYYVHISTLKKTSESDVKLTAMARICFADVVTRKHPQVRKAVRAALLRDYHPDKLNGAHWYATAVNYIQEVFAHKFE